MPRKSTNQTKKKIRRRKQAEEYCSYLIEILSAKFRYSISENRGKKICPGPYSEYPAIEIIGKGVEPTKIAGKEFDCTIYGSREQDIRLNNPEEFADETRALVGHISGRKDKYSLTCWIPASALMPVAQMILVNDLRYFDLMGNVLFRNEASIQHFSLVKEPEAE